MRTHAYQTDSVFAEAYANGINKKLYHEPMLEDCLNVIARLPKIAALIYRCTFHVGSASAIVTFMVIFCVAR
jgi:citrate synthase